MLHRRILAAASIFCILTAGGVLAYLVTDNVVDFAANLSRHYLDDKKKIPGFTEIWPTKAENIYFLDEDGAERGLEAFKGTPVLVNFWATWCPPCIRELPALYELSVKHEGKLAVIAISADAGGFDKIHRFLETHPLPHPPFYWDKELRAFRKFVVRAMPSTFVIDRKGRIVGRIEGEIDWRGESAAAILTPLLAERTAP